MAEIDKVIVTCFWTWAIWWGSLLLWAGKNATAAFALSLTNSALLRFCFNTSYSKEGGLTLVVKDLTVALMRATLFFCTAHGRYSLKVLAALLHDPTILLQSTQQLQRVNQHSHFPKLSLSLQEHQLAEIPEPATDLRSPNCSLIVWVNQKMWNKNLK